MTLQKSFIAHLACPHDHAPLTGEDGGVLLCSNGHSFPVIQDIPVLLTNDLPETHPYFTSTQALVGRVPTGMTDLTGGGPSGVDAFVQDEIIKTNGNLYRHLKGKLPRYPIPDLRLPLGDGALLLDVGCNWGRWTLAAARRGYRAIGLDPSLEACLAAQRVARQLGVDAAFVVGDARRLPFAEGALDAVFSYSVLQHFAKTDARHALGDMARVTRPGGTVLVQMPNIFGARQAYNRMRQILRQESNLFRVRYWTPRELARTFEDLVGPTSLSVDGFFSLNPQATDLDLLTPGRRRVVWASELLRRLAQRMPALTNFADSLYVQSIRSR